MIAQELGGFCEALIKELAQRGGQILLVQRARHGAQPCIAHGAIHRNTPVPHAQPRMSVRRDVVLRTAEPANQEERKPLLVFALHVPVLVAGMELCERGFVAGHDDIEALDDAAHGRCAAEKFVRRWRGIGHL